MDKFTTKKIFFLAIFESFSQAFPVFIKIAEIFKF